MMKAPVGAVQLGPVEDQEVAVAGVEARARGLTPAQRCRVVQDGDTVIAPRKTSMSFRRVSAGMRADLVQERLLVGSGEARAWRRTTRDGRTGGSGAGLHADMSGSFPTFSV